MQSEQIGELAKALSLAQGNSDHIAESKILKKFADYFHPLKRVNQLSARPMPIRFFEKIAYGMSSCWTWRGGINKCGYGTFSYQGEGLAHRVAYKLFNGDIPKNLYVLHKCDNRQCVNPEHLFLGTQHDNMRDMVNKGRSDSLTKKGEKNPRAKLTKIQVDEIRSLFTNGVKQYQLCEKFLVSPQTISRIVRNKGWL